MRYETHIDEDKWFEFVYNHKNANIFQTPNIFELYQRTHKYEPTVVFSVNESGEIEGIISGVTINEMDGILGKMSSRTIVQGGPLLSQIFDDQRTREFVSIFDDKIGKSSIFTEFRNMNDSSSLNECLDDYEYIDHLNFIIALNRTEEEVWSSIHKSRRKNINRSEKYGVVIEEITDISEIPIFYSLLQETYSNVKIPLADISLFKSAFELLVPMGMAKFYLAKHDDKYIGSRAILTFKDTVFDWYAGASVDSLSLYPNESLVWHILKWGVENNYSYFDFGGAGHPDKPYGPREFKRRFGGELVNFGRYQRVNNKFLMKLAENGYKLYQKICL